MKAIAKVFLTGLFTVLPILATVYLIVWLFAGTERFIGAQVRWLIPDEYYRYGMGIALALVLVFLVGLLMRAWLFRKLIDRAERLFLEIPLVRSIYAALRDLLGLFARPSDKLPMQVVSVEPPGAGMRLLGFVTRADFSDLPEGIGRDGEVAVYLPMSYMIGGYTVIVPRKWVTPLDMSREEAMTFVVTAGIRASAERHAAER
jgi:uncharacterized membrane protein